MGGKGGWWVSLQMKNRLTKQSIPPQPIHRPRFIPPPRPLKHKPGYSWEFDMTVCIAARTILNNENAVVLCMDMMGSSDWNSAETSFKWHPLPQGFYALLAGPSCTARELATHCGTCLILQSDHTVPSVLHALRNGLGAYKRSFADAHVQGRLGISYDEFRRKGKTSLPEDLYREIADSEGWRSAFRTDVDHDSEVMPISVPN